MKEAIDILKSIKDLLEISPKLLYAKALALLVEVVRFFGRKPAPPPPSGHPVKRDRFPKKEATKINYGYVNYPPLLYCDDNDRVIGVGKVLFEKLFPKNEKEPIRAVARLKIEWDKIEDALYEQEDVLDENGNSKKYKIDAIATPLFETKTRSKKMLFCSPIFFSEVGIYVKQDGRLHQYLKENLQSSYDFNFLDTIDWIEKYPKALKISCIGGEISEKMLNKYLSTRNKGDDITKHIKGKKEIPGLINKLVADEHDNEYTDIVFTESYQAQKSIHYFNPKDNTGEMQERKVINVLKSGQLLYPVSFAVRSDNYLLRNYINLKLLEIERADTYGILGVIADEIFTNTLDDSDDKSGKKEVYNDEVVKRLKHDIKSIWKDNWKEKWLDKKEQMKWIRKYFISSRSETLD